MRIDSISEVWFDELAAAAVGLPGLPTVTADPIARAGSPQEPDEGLVKLAATLIVAGSWGYRARFRGAMSRGAGRPRDRKDLE
jgi:hypothetical protein